MGGEGGVGVDVEIWVEGWWFVFCEISEFGGGELWFEFLERIR